MEQNYRPDNQPAPAVSEVTEFCGDVLTGSNSDLRCLIAGNSVDVMRGSANASPLDRGLDEKNKGDSCGGKGTKEEFLMDDRQVWTNEKHNLYLNHLEVSFVKQLNQSVGFLVRCSEQNNCERRVSQKRPSRVHDASVQRSILWHGCREKINQEREQLLFHTSTDDHGTLKSQCIYCSQKMRKQCPSLLADIQESLKLQNADKHITRKRVSSQGLTTRPQQLASDLYRGDSFEFLKEGAGQNFVDEGCQKSQPNILSHAKRLKRDRSAHDQIVPSGKFHTVVNSATDNSTLEGELLHREGVSENLESFVYPPT